MPHAKIKEKFKKAETSIVIDDLKFTFNPIPVGDALVLTGSPMLEYATNPGSLTELSEHPDKEEIYWKTVETQKVVVQKFVTHIDDEPYQLDNEDIENLGILNIAQIYDAITGRTTWEAVATRNFRKQD